MRSGTTAILLGLLLCAPVHATPPAHEHARDCAGQVTAPPAGLSGWSTPAPATAAGNEAGLAAAVIPVGARADAVLRQTGDIRYVARPEKPGGSVSFGGMFAFDVTEPGTYRVALDSAAWIDVLRNGKAVASTAHGPGPECSGIRKMVDFPLEPGRYVLQLAANGKPAIAVLVARLP